MEAANNFQNMFFGETVGLLGEQLRFILIYTGCLKKDIHIIVKQL